MIGVELCSLVCVAPGYESGNCGKSVTLRGATGNRRSRTMYVADKLLTVLVNTDMCCNGLTDHH